MRRLKTYVDGYEILTLTQKLPIISKCVKWDAIKGKVRQVASHYYKLY